MALSGSVVSVLLPAYNEERYIEAALRSLIRQTHRDLDIVVVDDGSTDRTAEIVDAWHKTESRIRMIQQDNQGIVGALNAAWRAAEGAFIARMDANDVSAPERFEHQLAYLERHPEVGLVGSWLASTDPEGRPTGKVWRTPVLPGAIIWGLHFETALVHASMLGRRSEMEVARPYRSEGVEHLEDYDLLVRLVDSCRMASLPEILYYRRELATGITRIHADRQADGVKQVMRGLWSRRLDRELSPEAAKALFELHRGQQVAKELIPETRANLCALRTSLQSGFELSAEDKEAIDFELGRKLAVLGIQSLRFRQLFSGGKMLGEALRLSPLELPRRGARSLVRGLLRTPRGRKSRVA